MTALLAPHLNAATPAENSSEQAILGPIQAMFDGMSKHDAAAIQQPLLAGGTIVAGIADTGHATCPAR